MEESAAQEACDITYSSFRNLNWFVKTLEGWVQEGKKVLMADCAFANGGDMELLDLLDDYGILDRLVSYKAWNTHCNTLGTTIAQGVMAFLQEYGEEQRLNNLIYHILDDCLYQAVVRKQMAPYLEERGLSYFDLKEKQEEVCREEAQMLQKEWDEHICKSFPTVKSLHATVYHPWNRMFEIGLELDNKFRIN